MSTIDSLIKGQHTPGVYRFASRVGSHRVRSLVEACGWHLFYLDGAHIQDKDSFLHACAEAMRFPSYFGRNWDALADSITDLAWAPALGYILLYDKVGVFARQHPDTWRTAGEILEDAVAYWGTTKTPMYVLLRGTTAMDRSLPRL